ncbi:MAG: hypothetical protein GEU97_18400 [Actinophytocola sp.]|nr:hypothetical protein [Actinophytocola sp.]
MAADASETEIATGDLVRIDDLGSAGLSELFVLTVRDAGFDTEFQTTRGEPVLWAYSSIEALVDACGNGQPYERLTVADLVAASSRVDARFVVALDVRHPDGVRYPEPELADMEPLEPIDETARDTSVVWVPTRPLSTIDRRVDVELHSNVSGERLLLVFSSLERLRATCGPQQVAAAIQADRIGVVAERLGAHGVVFDAQVSHAAPPSPSRHEQTVRNRFGYEEDAW